MQRLRDREALQNVVVVDEFIRDMAIGKSSCAQVARFCKLLQESGRADAGISVIASFSGQNPARDLMRKLNDAYDCGLEPCEMRIRMLSAEGVPTYEDMHGLLPFEIVKELGLAGPSRFKTCLLGSGGWDGVKHYWDELGKGVRHHVNLDPSWASKRSRTLPMYYHFDGIEVTKGKSKISVSFCCPLNDTTNTTIFNFQFCFWTATEFVMRHTKIWFHYLLGAMKSASLACCHIRTA